MLCDIYAFVEKGRIYVVDKMNVVLRPILNSNKNVKITDSRGVWRRVWGLMEKYGTYIVWRVWWLVEENGTYGASEFYVYIYIFEVLDGLCVWIEVWEKVFVLMPTFWKDFRFFIL